MHSTAANPFTQPGHLKTEHLSVLYHLRHNTGIQETSYSTLMKANEKKYIMSKLTFNNFHGKLKTKLLSVLFLLQEEKSGREI